MSRFGVIATAAMAALAFGASAFAAPLTITFDDNAGTTKTLVDGVDDLSLDGFLVSGPHVVGTWNVTNLLISSSDPQSAQLISGSGDVSGGAGHLTITITNTYSGLDGFGSTYTNITPTLAQGTLNYSSTVDGTTVGSVLDLGAPTTFEAWGSTPLDGSAFDIVQVIDIFHSAAGFTKFDAVTNVSVPEPGILGLLGLGLLGMGIAARRRKVA